MRYAFTDSRAMSWLRSVVIMEQELWGGPVHLGVTGAPGVVLLCGGGHCGSEKPRRSGLGKWLLPCPHLHGSFLLR